MTSNAYVERRAVGSCLTELLLWFQIAVDNAGKLQAIEAAYYSDDGCSINDCNLFPAMGHWDNGRYTLCNVAQSSNDGPLRVSKKWKVDGWKRVMVEG